MTEKKQHRTLKAFKVAFITLLVLAGLLVFGRYMLTTNMVHNFVKNKATEIANKSLNGTLSIGELEGDLWKEIRLINVSVVQQDTLVKVDTLYAAYEVWSFLSDLYTINKFSITGVHANVEETQDTVFNVQQLVKEDASSEMEPEEEARGFNITIQEITLRDINARVYSPSLLPDSVLRIKNLNADASFLKSDTTDISLSRLGFLLQEGRLPEPIRIKTSGRYLEEEITMQEMVIETGRSMLQLTAEVNLADTTGDSYTNLSPISMSDIQPYLDYELPPEDFEMQLSLGGSLDSLQVNLKIQNQYINQLEIASQISLRGEPTVLGFGLLGQGLNIAGLTSDSVDLSISDLRFTLSGNLNSDISSADVVLGFDLFNIRYEDYSVSRWFGSGVIENGDFIGNSQIDLIGQQKAFVTPTIWGITSDNPSWELSLSLNNINPGVLLNDPALDGDINLSAKARGTGFELSDESWMYSIQNKSWTYSSPPREFLSSNPQIQRTRIYNYFGGQQISELSIEGFINNDTLTADGFVQLINSKLVFDGEISDYTEDLPTLSFRMRSPDFNVAELTGFEDFPTMINLEVEGTTRGFDPYTATVNASVEIDSSIINGAKFNHFSSDLNLEDGILTIRQGTLDSDIVTGSVEGRRNLGNIRDVDNKLSIDMLINNPQPLAPLIGVNIIEASGTLKGEILQDASGLLASDMNLDLVSVRVDSLFIAERINGQIKGIIGEYKQFDSKLSIESPEISGVNLEDITLEATGRANEDSLDADFKFRVYNSERGELLQEGTIRSDFNNGLFDLNFSRFDFITPGSVLQLEKPFRVRYKNMEIGTDTLRLNSNSGAFLNFAIPYADSLEQHAWINGRDFDFGIIQEIVFGERFFEGILSGQLSFDHYGSEIESEGALILKDLNYLDIEADSLNINYSIGDQKLAASASIAWDDEEKISGHLNIPFVLLEEELDDSFYAQPIEGNLNVKPTDLMRFKPLLVRMGITETSGILSFNGSMSGTAGEPRFNGNMTLGKPVLSGIKVDTVFVDFDYDHTKNDLLVRSEILAAGQSAAVIDAEYPLIFDFRTFTTTLPGEDDIINVDVQTRNFNMAVFNDFLNKEYMDRLIGTLNMNLNLRGTPSEMTPSGFVRLSNSSIRIPIAGISLQNLKADMEFTSAGLKVNDISANSGRGNMKVDGNIDLRGIVPETLNLNARASRFRVANTPDYNMVINMNSRLRGDITSPEISGSLAVLNGFIYLQDFGERDIEEVHLEEEEERSVFSPYDSLSINMEFEIERNFYVRNRSYLDMDVEIVGDLEAQKEKNGELQLFGSLTGVEGFVKPLSKRFDIEHANIVFSGPVEDPELDIKSKYVPPTQHKGEEVELFYIIEGTGQEPEFSFESNPPMEQSDFICYTLFSKPCYSLESWQNTVAGEGTPSASDILAEVLIDQVETLASSQLGVDVVQIDSGTDGGLSIKTGWYLSERTFFAVINEITNTTPKMLFTIEYILTDYWDLIVTQGDDPSQGVDFRFQYDY